MKSNREDTVNTQITCESEEIVSDDKDVDFLRGCVYDETDERYKKLE